MKRKFFITLIFTLFTYCVFSSICFADSGLYLTTDPCPDAYIEYAEEHILDFVIASEDYIITDYNDITVGTPFNFGNTISNIYYFPVMNNGELIYLFRVYPNGNDYSATMSIFLVDELNNLSNQTSATTPMTLMMRDSDIVASIGDFEYVLFSYPDYIATNDNDDCIATPESVLSRTVVDITTEMDLDLVQSGSPLSSDATFKSLPLTIKNTQGNTSWCAAYVSDIILRYIGAVPSTHSYQNIVNYFSLTTNTSLSFTDVRTYANTKGVSPYYIAKNSYTNSDLVNEIDNNRPVYISMISTSSTDGSGHAVALRGYNLTSNTYSIWNPWYTFYETYSIDGIYVPALNSTWNFELRGIMAPWAYSY